MVDDYLFVATGFALFYHHLAFSDPKLFCQILDQMGIGLAVYRRGGDGDFQFVAMLTDNSIAAGFGLDVES